MDLRSSVSVRIAALLLCCAPLAATHSAQPALPFSLEQLSIGLPEEGAPRAVVGPYAVTSQTIAGSPGFVVYRPRDPRALAAGERLPVVVWGNGACLADGSGFSGFLSTIASYGFLVVTSAAVPGEPQARVTSRHLLQALDWSTTQAARTDAALAGRLDTSAVAVMGMSCGGNLALEAARDPRVKTLGMWNSGVWNSGEMRTGDGTLLVATTKADLAHVHSPTLYINGAIDPAKDNAADDFARLGVPVFFGVRSNAGHAGTYSHANGGEFANVAVAWLSWRLKGDAGAGRMFTGADCSLCRDPNWIVQRKGL
jgi:hypothetical protein